MTSAPVRVLHVITGLELGGAETMLYRLITSFPKSEVETAVVSLRSEGRFGGDLTARGIPVRTMGLFGPRDIVRAFRGVRAAARDLEPDVIHGWMYHGNLAASLAAGRRKPTIWSIRQSLPDVSRERAGTRLAIRMGARLSSSVASVTYNSGRAMADHAAIGFQGQSLLIPNGFDTTRFRPNPEARRAWREEHGIVEGGPVIAYLARWHPVKDHRTFFAAVGKIAARIPGARFVLAGTGITTSNGELLTLIDRWGLRHRCLLLGEVANVPSLLAGVDLVCSTSRNEGFPNALGEAICAGVPCVTTDAGDAPLVVGDHGAVVPVGDPERVAHACLEVLAWPEEERARRRAAARDRAVRDFDLGAVARRYLSLYHAVRRGRVDE